jgi:hypothetical protein
MQKVYLGSKDQWFLSYFSLINTFSRLMEPIIWALCQFLHVIAYFLISLMKFLKKKKNNNSISCHAFNILVDFFLDSKKLHFRKAYFMDPGEGVKPQPSQALTRGACHDSHSRPAGQISNPLPSRYVPWRQYSRRR